MKNKSSNHQADIKNPNKGSNVDIPTKQTPIFRYILPPHFELDFLG